MAKRDEWYLEIENQVRTKLQTLGYKTEWIELGNLNELKLPDNCYINKDRTHLVFIKSNSKTIEFTNVVTGNNLGDMKKVIGQITISVSRDVFTIKDLNRGYSVNAFEKEKEFFGTLPLFVDMFAGVIVNCIQEDFYNYVSK